MQELIKIAGLMALSGVKFFLAPSTVIFSGYGFWDTIWISSIGGIIGFLVFFYFGQLIQGRIQSLFKSKKNKTRFNKKNRFIVKVRRKYGLWGLAFLTPCLFSIPIGAVMASIYYSKRKGVQLIFGVMILVWSFILTSITFFVKES